MMPVKRAVAYLANLLCFRQHAVSRQEGAICISAGVLVSVLSRSGKHFAVLCVYVAIEENPNVHYIKLWIAKCMPHNLENGPLLRQLMVKINTILYMNT